jgi:hypothetical protein
MRMASEGIRGRGQLARSPGVAGIVAGTEARAAAGTAAGAQAPAAARIAADWPPGDARRWRGPARHRVATLRGVAAWLDGPRDPATVVLPESDFVHAFTNDVR